MKWESCRWLPSISFMDILWAPSHLGLIYHTLRCLACRRIIIICLQFCLAALHQQNLGSVAPASHSPSQSSHFGRLAKLLLCSCPLVISHVTVCGLCKRHYKRHALPGLAPSVSANLCSSTSITLSFRYKLTIGAQPGFRSGKGPISSVLRVGLVRTLAVRNWLRRVPAKSSLLQLVCWWLLDDVQKYSCGLLFPELLQRLCCISRLAGKCLFSCLGSYRPLHVPNPKERWCRCDIKCTVNIISYHTIHKRIESSLSYHCHHNSCY